MSITFASAAHSLVRWRVLMKTCKRFEEEFGCKVGHTSEDGKVTLEFVECHADCGRAPVVMVGEEEYTDIDPDKAAEMAAKMKSGELSNGLPH